MRVLIVTEPSGGGSGRHVVDLSSGLVNRGHEVHLIYSSVRAESGFLEQIQAIECIKLYDAKIMREVGFHDFAAASRIWGYINKHGPFDVIHAHSSKAGALIRIIPTGNSSIIYTPHALKTMDPALSAKSKLLYASIEQILARVKEQKIIAVSGAEYEHMQDLGLPKQRLATIYNGLSADAFDLASAKTRLAIRERSTVVGFVGRLCDQKDPLKFADVVEELIDRGLDVEGIVLGDGELKDLLAKRGRGRLVIHSGLAARPLIGAFDCLVMTSKFEAMPYVLIEALHAGLPIVSTEVGGALDAIEQGINGFVVPLSASPSEIADAVEIAISVERNAELRAASLQRSKRFSLEEMLSSTIATYSCER